MASPHDDFAGTLANAGRVPVALVHAAPKARDGSLGNIEAELEQFTANARSSPGGIPGNHAENQLPQLFTDSLPAEGLSLPARFRGAGVALPSRLRCISWTQPLALSSVDCCHKQVPHFSLFTTQTAHEARLCAVQERYNESVVPCGPNRNLQSIAVRPVPCKYLVDQPGIALSRR